MTLDKNGLSPVNQLNVSLSWSEYQPLIERSICFSCLLIDHPEVCVTDQQIVTQTRHVQMFERGQSSVTGGDQ